MNKLRLYKELGMVEAYPSLRSLAENGPRGPHVFSDHPTLFGHVNVMFARPYDDPARPRPPVFQVLPPGTTIEQAAASTNLLVFIGAESSPALDWAAARPDVVKFIFEPDPARLAAYLRDRDPKADARANMFFFAGDPGLADPPLSQVPGEAMRGLRYPVFFVQEGLVRDIPGYVNELTRTLEIIFYRHHIYPLEGQWMSRSRPIREITRGFFYDQQKHLYENAPDILAHGDIGGLDGCCRGATAIIATAGPDLARRLDYIREQAENALVITVSRSLKELLEAGIEPHVAIINDTSVDAEGPLSGLPRQDRTILAAHCLSPTGGDAFARKAFFGTALPEILGKRPMLRLHGSVLTTACSLARWMGCNRCVLVGAQMVSNQQNKIIHSKKSADVRPDHRPLEPPRLVPVVTPAGVTRYASLNFLDARHWFLEEVRRTGLEVINTCADTIIHGPGVTIDENYQIPPGPDVPAALEKADLSSRGLPKEPVAGWLKNEQTGWRNAAKASANVLASLGSPGGLEAAAKLISLFDANNTSHLVERYRDYPHHLFYEFWVRGGRESNPKKQLKGAAMYFSHIREMAEGFMGITAQSLARLRNR